MKEDQHQEWLRAQIRDAIKRVPEMLGSKPTAEDYHAFLLGWVIGSAGFSRAEVEQINAQIGERRRGH
jgi:hypothetical protein